MASKRATPYIALAIGVPAAELDGVEREIEADTALWTDRVEALDAFQLHLRGDHDLIVIGAGSPKDLQEAAELLGPVRQARARRLPALAVLSSNGHDPTPHPAEIDGVSVGRLRAESLRAVLALVEEAPCPYTADDGMADLADEYLARRRVDLVALQAALKAGDRKAVAQRAHRFRGTGAVYGFPAISEAGAGIERAAQGGSDREVETWIRALGHYLADGGREEKEGG